MIKPILPKQEVFLICSISLLLLLFTTGCIETFGREIVSSRVVEVGNFTVKEEIYRTEGFPDHTFERFYEATHGDMTIGLGSFEDQSAVGIVHSPVVLDGQLAIFTSSHLFLWRPGDEPIHFSPFSAVGWYDYSQNGQLNGHYDYAASNLTIGSGQMLLHYTCSWCDENKPERLLFYSLDAGRTFDICLAPAPDYARCLD